MAAKFKQVYNEMIANNKTAFSSFQLIHDGYLKDRKMWSEQFHTQGKEILEIIHHFESILCAGTERTKPAYSARLAERFKIEIKKKLPLLDLIGTKSSFD